jgi:hypothetical protein
VIRLRQLGAATAAGLGLIVATIPAAAADPLSAAVAHLRTADVYVDPSATADGVKLDQAAVTRALPPQLKIAVLPDSAGRAINIARSVGAALRAGPGNRLTIAVLTVTGDGQGSFRAGSARYCPGFADAQASAAVSEHTADLENGLQLTATIEDFVKRLANGPLGLGHCAPLASATTSTGQDSGAGTAWLWVTGVAASGTVGVAGLVFFRRRRSDHEAELALAAVIPYYDQLADDINTLDPKNLDQARLALSDARRHFGSAAAQLAIADTAEQYDLARRTVLEGLYATRTARNSLGIDPGPPLPPMQESRYEQLIAPRQVTVRGQQHQGYPAYTPGAPFCFEGGPEVPGGWYRVPFWETTLLGSLLGAGGYGADLPGPGYGIDYEGGHPAGRDASAGDSGGGDFGSGGTAWAGDGDFVGTGTGGDLAGSGGGDSCGGR